MISPSLAATLPFAGHAIQDNIQLASAILSQSGWGVRRVSEPSAAGVGNNFVEAPCRTLFEGSPIRALGAAIIAEGGKLARPERFERPTLRFVVSGNEALRGFALL
jgi:hypothetical protein